MEKYKIKSNISEKQIEADVSCYFGWISAMGSIPFRLLDINEQKTGADKEFNYDRCVPIYIQFKKSEGLIPLPANKNLSYFEKKKPLQLIRLFRRNENLDGDPILYLKLREKKDNAIDFQHNILLDLRNKPNTEAFYVAPLVLDKIEYHNKLFDSTNRFLFFPFNYIKDLKIYYSNWISHIGFIPILRLHISIPPTDKISTNEHFYSFSESGTDIVWHSGKIISNEINRLSDKLINIFYKIFTYDDYWIKLSDHFDIYKDLYDIMDIKPSALNPFELVQYFGKQLNELYNIRQILIFKNS